MNDIRPIDLSLRARLDGVKLSDAGDCPELMWIPIKFLVIDQAYQRDILSNGAINVVSIAVNFSWKMFGAIVVAPVGDGLYAIIDGQHRTTAAAIRGDIDSVPCLVVKADRAGQAAAFAAINGSVTKMTSSQIFLAKLAAGDSLASQVKAACDEAGVSILRTTSRFPKPGETSAINGLVSLFRAFGRDVFVQALRSIVASGETSIGMLRPNVMKAMCVVLEAEPKWRTHPRLIRTMQDFDFAGRFKEANVAAREQFIAVVSALCGFITAHLDQRLEAKAA